MNFLKVLKFRGVFFQYKYDYLIFKLLLPIQIKQNASVQPHMLSQIFLVCPTVNPLCIKRFENQPAIITPGIISIQGITLKIQLWACGKLSWK